MKLGETDLVQNVNVRLFGGTDNINSVRLILVISKHRLGKANSVGPTAHFGESETL